MKNGKRLVSFLLVVALLVGVGCAGTGAQAEKYVYKEPYMREAVKRSFYMQMGIMAFFQEEECKWG